MAHWLTEKTTIRLLWRWSLAILAALVVIGMFIDPHPHFGIDAVVAFPAWFGFIACIVLIVVAKAIGLVLKRRDTYYPPESESGRE